MKKLHVTLSGMHCDGCVQAVRSALDRADGVQACDVRLNEADIDFNPDACGVADILAVIRAVGTFDVTGFSTDGE